MKVYRVTADRGWPDRCHGRRPDQHDRRSYSQCQRNRLGNRLFSRRPPLLRRDRVESLILELVEKIHTTMMQCLTDSGQMLGMCALCFCAPTHLLLQVQVLLETRTSNPAQRVNYAITRDPAVVIHIWLDQ